MDAFDTIRDLARKCHREARDKAGGDTRATSLLNGATANTGIGRQAVAPDDPLLCGAEAILDPSVPAIFYKNTAPSAHAAFFQAHEFGHHWLHNATGGCAGDDLNDTMPEEPIPLGIQRVEGYGPRERRECQANVFAREFLLPCEEARRLFIEEKQSATAIAEKLGIPLSLVYQQLTHALLVPETEPKPEAEYKNPPLDDSQKNAAEAQDGPHLIEAGPGTGKTRTLIARINWLLDHGTDPSSILALTFSNKAAEEMRDRVAIAAPDAAPHIWAGTFHAFGLEMLRKFGHLLGLPADIRVADPSDALLLLEEHLPSLPLSHYLRLHEPAMDLRNILTAISRAKDELIGPAEYLAYGEEMMAAAQDESTREAAEKVIEVAKVFSAYEEILKSKSIVDFADLILKAIILLRDHPEIGEAMRAQYNHILVDEYQDVNRACGILLKLLAGNGKNLWVVGDARQSIYRFRGASPQNIREFETDFPGATRLQLAINYRSQERVVRLFEAFAPMMRASVGGLPAKWEVNRKDGSGEILMEVASNIEAEAAGLTREIIRRRDQGIPFREQAILCRSHTNLARFALRLEAQGIPVLYLGDLFERPEIRDMLALISFTCEPERGGLLRVARFPEYDVSIEDVRTVLSFAKDENIQPPDALKRLDEIPDITGHGLDRLALLKKHLKNVNTGTTPAGLLFDYIFCQSRFLDPLLADTSVQGQQKRIALFQLLQFAAEHNPVEAGNPRRQLLQWIRRLETFGDERQLRQLPAGASGIDAVRMLTVHASKGLEFKAVYLPALGNTIFPAKPQYTPCPPPAGMLAEDPKDSHIEEEECLFFVAMSRARDVLCLSRAEKYGAVSSKASPLLTMLTRYLPKSPEAAANWQDHESEELIQEALLHLVPEIDIHAAEDLDQYKRCPLAYLYQRVLDLSGGREDNAYVQFHRTVYGVLRWITDMPVEETLHIDDVLARLDAAWGNTGPSDHPYAPLYRDAANTLVERAVARRANAALLVAGEWEIERPNGKIKVRADQIELTPSGPVVRRMRTGRPPKKVDDDLYALYHVGAQETHGPVQVEVHYLTTDESVPVEMSAKVISNRLKKYDSAMAGINAGDFPPQPSDRHCPGCPQYFICPGIPRKS